MRLQLALNVDDLDQAIDYYSKLFGATPNKVKPGYANFAIDAPPLKLVLFENAGASERLNHLGVETFEQESVDEAIVRLEAAGIAEAKEEETTCCYAKANKVWSVDPQGMRWEWYRVLEDADQFGDGDAVAASREPTEATEPAQSEATGVCCG
jgi:uncharacterized glyoxalase superfamily protein PhnB